MFISRHGDGAISKTIVANITDKNQTGVFGNYVQNLITLTVHLFITHFHVATLYAHVRIKFEGQNQIPSIQSNHELQHLELGTVKYFPCTEC